MMDLRDLYQDVILDHSKNPRNAGRPEHPDHEAKGNNPLCGDKITVYVTLEDGVIADIRFEARGCAISVASASMMSELAKGRSADDIRDLFEGFHEAVTSKEPVSPEAIEKLDKLAALIGVREFPMRVKCATLPWHTMAAAIANSAQEVTTE
jgi:nitrogen fixation protein NifU and related proteins